MDAKLKRIIADNGLTSISVSMHTGHVFRNLPFSAYVHWDHDNGCKGGSGKTVAEAVEDALRQMRVERAKEMEAA